MLDAPTRFPTTRWTLILEAQSSPEARQRAFEELARIYWRPLFVYLRSRGLDASAAQDSTQELLLKLMQRDVVAKVDPNRGRLRAYLKTAAANHLLHEHEKRAAQKRGDGRAVVPIDEKLAERLPYDTASPDLAFEREWALLVMQRALDALRAEFESGERTGPFALVETFFRPSTQAQPSYADAARAHRMSLPQLKAFLHRARVRFRELVKAQVLDTVNDEAEAERELAALVEVLAK
ncbi:MAG: sigma-70 family RNA polymerase sigma factor [Archangiaceae bacterium]|nr:sigma-70 family RNA polymerase sigma factor [Archangiaceae bacterium]